MYDFLRLSCAFLTLSLYSFQSYSSVQLPMHDFGEESARVSLGTKISNKIGRGGHWDENRRAPGRIGRDIRKREIVGRESEGENLC